MIALADEPVFVDITEAVHARSVQEQFAELRESGRLHEVFTQPSVEGASTAEAVRQVAALRGAGFGHDVQRRRVSLRGRRAPHRYLGADDRAGPDYTGQPAVDSYYEPLS